MNIAIIDDEQCWLERVCEWVEQYCPQAATIHTYTTGSMFLSNKTCYDLIFVDIEIGEENGFEIIEAYKEKHPDTFVIVLTMHTELSRQGYRFDIFRYIDKSCLAELEEAVTSASKRMGQRKEIRLLIPNGLMERLRCESILYFESYGHHIYVTTVKERFECKNTMEELTEQLERLGFYRVHRSYLVNMKYVKNLTRSEVDLSNGDKVSLSRRKYQDFKTKILQWKLENGRG